MVALIQALFNTATLFCACIALSFLCKLLIFIGTLRYSFRRDINKTLIVLLLFFLLGTLFNDICFGGSFILRSVFGFKGDIPVFTLINRLDWTLFITQYQAFALFVIMLTQPAEITNSGIGYSLRRFFAHLSKTSRMLVYGSLGINLITSACFFYLASVRYGVDSSSAETLPFELMLINSTYVYITILFTVLFYNIFKKIRQETLPRIIKHQLYYVSLIFIGYFLLEAICNHYPLLKHILPLSKTHFYILMSFFGSCTAYLCSRRIMGLRFLNIRKTIESKEKFNFLTHFNDILLQLSKATTFHELGSITQLFFYQGFSIPLHKTHLFTRDAAAYEEKGAVTPMTVIAPYIEHFLVRPENRIIIQQLAQTKIFIRDEIEFNYFTENDNPHLQAIVHFLQSINADVFIPIYERDAISAFIVIERQARSRALFTNKERDEMLIFTNYLSNNMQLLKQPHMIALQKQHNALTHELYQKHQEIQHYKESIRSFMRTSSERKIGIIFYKNRHFTIAHEETDTFIGFDLNAQPGHALSQVLKAAAKRTLEYKNAYITYARDQKNNKIIIHSLPNLNDSTVILLLYHPEMTDLIKQQLDKLKDPSAWDYLLYLETTQAGMLINELIPGMSEKILNFKIELLSTALSKKATLLIAPEDDVPTIVSILHHISLRKTVHELTLSSPEKQDEIALMLFGLNPLLDKNAPEGLLKKLDTHGTLFIKNIEYLSLDTQNLLAQYLTTGYCTLLKSEQKMWSNVRIICSTAKDLVVLAQEGKFSSLLLNELNKTTLIFPAMHTFAHEELVALGQEYAHQIHPQGVYKNLLALSPKDSKNFCDEKPLSLKELKERVQHLVQKKASKYQIHEVSSQDPAYGISEPDIAHAIRLGKKALKDPQLMTLLWNKFKNQNKIAQLLGVNRSTINRRCQEYNLRD